MRPRLHGIALAEDPGERLRLVAGAEGTVAVLPRAGLNAGLVAAWAARFGLELLDDVPGGARPSSPLASLATIVLVADPRVAMLAGSYAAAVRAPSVPVPDPDAVVEAVAGAPRARSATLVLLNDRLDDALIDAVGRGNAQRMHRGRTPLTLGIVTAFDAPKLAWLLLKTLACLDLRRPPDPAIGRFDGVRGTATIRSLDAAPQPMTTREPWTDPRTLAQSVVAHGVAFDLSLGDDVLCGHVDPPLPAARLAVAPSCFHDGVCFRLARPGGPSVRRRAHETTPLVWGIDSCGAIPFRDNAFGNGSSYALALLAGSAVAIVGPYLTLTSSGLAARVFEALLANGWSTGEIAAALGGIDDNTVGFDPYLVLGSPDVRLAPACAAALAEDGAIPVAAGNTDTVAVELAPDMPGLRDVVADDGDDAWRDALARRVEAPGRAALVVMFGRTRRFTGSLRLGDVGASRAALAERCDELDRRLGVLAGYGFAAPDASLAEAIRVSVRETAETLRARYVLRAASVGMRRWVHSVEAMRPLEESVARHFLDAVVEHDVSFDRESEAGFVPGPLTRSSERCHVCRGPLYVAVDRWAADQSYQRLKGTCPNCFGVVMRLPTSPLASVGIAATVRGATYHVGLTLHSAVKRPLRAVVAAAPRRGPAEQGTGPVSVDVAEGREGCLELSFPAARRGVVTYRILVLCEGAAELYTAIDGGAPSSASSSPSEAMVVGFPPRSGHGRSARLNQIG